MQRRVRALKYRKVVTNIFIGILLLTIGGAASGGWFFSKLRKSEELLAQKEGIIQDLISLQEEEKQRKEMARQVSQKEEREIWIAGQHLGEFIEAGTKIDLRITYANAEDYIVLSGKEVIAGNVNSGAILSLKESEILMLSSAIADIARFSKTKLYAVRYPELSEEVSKPNYIPNHEVAQMLKLKAGQHDQRTALEGRLEVHFKKN